MRQLPALVAQLCTMHDAWVVGSAAAKDADLSAVRDFDVLVPFREWHTACLVLPGDSVTNTFGGWKCQSEGRIIDVWPGDLDRLMTDVHCSWLWHPRSGVRVNTRGVRNEIRSVIALDSKEDH